MERVCEIVWRLGWRLWLRVGLGVGAEGCGFRWREWAGDLSGSFKAEFCSVSRSALSSSSSLEDS